MFYTKIPENQCKYGFLANIDFKQNSLYIGGDFHSVFLEFTDILRKRPLIPQNSQHVFHLYDQYLLRT